MTRGVMGITAMGGPVRAVSQMLTLNNGLTIPSLGFGTYRADPQEVGPALKYAVQCGFRHVDCAKIYMNEREIGVALHELMSSGKAVKREDLFITSKIWPTDQHPDHVEAACRNTLRDLRLDYLDLYLIHWPMCWKHTGKFDTDEDRRPRDANGLAVLDKSVSLADTWLAMMRLVDAGLVRSLGLSNCNLDHIKQVFAVVDQHKYAPVTNQIEFHPGCAQSQLWNDNRDHGMITSAYCPLGMPTRFTPPEFKGVVKDDVMGPLSVNSGYSPARLLLNWNLDHGNAVIVKATTKEHILDNSKACRFALSDSVRWVLNHYEDQMEKGVRVINPTDFLDEQRPFFLDGHAKKRVHRP